MQHEFIPNFEIKKVFLSYLKLQPIYIEGIQGNMFSGSIAEFRAKTNKTSES